MERKKILLIEDEVKLARFVELELKYEGYDVTTCHDGRVGMEMITNQEFDMILLDLMLPGLTGIEICRRVRKFSQVPIIMLTAKDEVMDKVAGLDSGADDYMTKPIDEEEMLWRIKALLRRAKIASERRIVVGDVVLDYDCLTVSRKGEVQELPQKEFLLLYKLLSYPGKIFTRIQLMDEIWGADSDTGWETVTVHVGRLRKRFQDWPEFTIESVRGLGYKAVKKV